MKTNGSKIEKKLLAACDKLAPSGWTGINWVRNSDTAIAIARAKAELPGQTRERVRQVREIVAGGLKSADIALLKRLVEQHISENNLDVKKSKELLAGVHQLRPLAWHQPVTRPPSAQRILALPREEVAKMTAEQVAKKVDCLEPWAAQVLRKNSIPFVDVREETGTRYPWKKVAPLEWYLLNDGEIGRKVGCHNVSVVAQYRIRKHSSSQGGGKIPKYKNPALTVIRRHFLGLPAARRFELVKEYLSGDQSGLDQLISKECKFLEGKLDHARTILKDVRLQVEAAVDRLKFVEKRAPDAVDARIAQKHVRAAKRRLAVAERKALHAEARVRKAELAMLDLRHELPGALRDLIAEIRINFVDVAEADWFPKVRTRNARIPKSAIPVPAVPVIPEPSVPVIPEVQPEVKSQEPVKDVPTAVVTVEVPVETTELPVSSEEKK